MEGQDALDKYREAGLIESRVQLVGVPKIEPYLKHRRTIGTIRNIGICSNLLDSLPAVAALIRNLKETFPELILTYRPHPSDRRTLPIAAELLFFDSKKINPYEFLLTQDLIIAGNTSIHYEAAMLNVHSIYYKFDDTEMADDLYGFVKNKLTQQAVNIPELIEIIHRIADQRGKKIENVAYYNALLGTPKEGKSKELVVKTMRNVLDGVGSSV